MISKKACFVRSRRVPYLRSRDDRVFELFELVKYMEEEIAMLLAKGVPIGSRPFRVTVQERFKGGKNFRQAFLTEAFDALESGEIEVGRRMLREYKMFGDAIH